MALNDLLCASVLLRNYSFTISHSLTAFMIWLQNKMLDAQYYICYRHFNSFHVGIYK